jgi:hypothetical protein
VTSKDNIVDFEWRTVQFFIGDEGVSEVELDTDDSRLVRCSCQGFTLTKKCKHQAFVLAKVEASNGNYGVQIPSDIPDELAFDTMDDADGWRNFVIKYGKIEVL